MGVRLIRLSQKNADPDTVPGDFPPVTIAADTPVMMSVCRYTQENMLYAPHTSDLQDLSTGDGYYFLNIDCAQRGVGTASCGPDVLERYRVRPGIFTMRLYLF
jgi:beta-galactosidase